MRAYASRRKGPPCDALRDFTEAGDRDEKMTLFGAAHLSIWAYSSAIQCGNVASALSSSICSVPSRRGDDQKRIGSRKRSYGERRSQRLRASSRGWPDLWLTDYVGDHDGCAAAGIIV